MKKTRVIKYDSETIFPVDLVRKFKKMQERVLSTNDNEKKLIHMQQFRYELIIWLEKNEVEDAS